MIRYETEAPEVCELLELTNLHEGTDYRALREALREHFSDRQISAPRTPDVVA